MTNLVLTQDVENLLCKKVNNLLTEMREMPQVDLQTKHYFGPSIYVREVTMPAGSVVIGKHHKKEHLCIMLQGRMIIIDEDGKREEMVAPLTYVAQPGRKVLYILETTVFQNLLATDETDIKVLENMLTYSTQPMLEGE
jgi:hypothetical protein